MKKILSLLLTGLLILLSVSCSSNIEGEVPPEPSTEESQASEPPEESGGLLDNLEMTGNPNLCGSTPIPEIDDETGKVKLSETDLERLDDYLDAFLNMFGILPDRDPVPLSSLKDFESLDELTKDGVLFFLLHMVYRDSQLYAYGDELSMDEEYFYHVKPAQLTRMASLLFDIEDFSYRDDFHYLPDLDEYKYYSDHGWSNVYFRITEKDYLTGVDESQSIPGQCQITVDYYPFEDGTEGETYQTARYLFNVVLDENNRTYLQLNTMTLA